MDLGAVDELSLKSANEQVDWPNFVSALVNWIKWDASCLNKKIHIWLLPSSNQTGTLTSSENFFSRTPKALLEQTFDTSLVSESYRTTPEARWRFLLNCALPSSEVINELMAKFVPFFSRRNISEGIVKLIAPCTWQRANSAYGRQSRRSIKVPLLSWSESHEVVAPLAINFFFSTWILR